MSCKFGTGQTIYDMIMSVDNNNNPVTATTFSIDIFRDGMAESGVTVNMVLSDPSTGAFSSTWSANTTGDYQILYKNDVTNVLFVTDTYNIVPDSDISTNVYIGL
jgi:hypothetical protein